MIQFIQLCMFADEEIGSEPPIFLCTGFVEVSASSFLGSLGLDGGIA